MEMFIDVKSKICKKFFFDEPLLVTHQSDAEFLMFSFYCVINACQQNPMAKTVNEYMIESFSDAYVMIKTEMIDASLELMTVGTLRFFSRNLQNTKKTFNLIGPHRHYKYTLSERSDVMATLTMEIIYRALEAEESWCFGTDYDLYAEQSYFVFRRVLWGELIHGYQGGNLYIVPQRYQEKLDYANLVKVGYPRCFYIHNVEGLPVGRYISDLMIHVRRNRIAEENPLAVTWSFLVNAPQPNRHESVKRTIERPPVGVDDMFNPIDRRSIFTFNLKNAGYRYIMQLIYSVQTRPRTPFLT
jgi:hypothetical protein